MRQISSRWTYFYKRVFPWLWFVVLGFFVITALSSIHRGHGPFFIAFLLPPALMGLIAYLLFRQLIFDLVDEVWDDGDALIVRNSGAEVRVALTNIVNVGFSVTTSPQRVTLMLREPGNLGKEITFSPPYQFRPFVRSPIVDELIARVDEARRRTRLDVP
jgi:hypothetical protein